MGIFRRYCRLAGNAGDEPAGFWASTSVLGALGCNMDTFKRYFPAASAMYEIFIWTAIGLVLLNLVWQLYRCYGAGFDIDTENPINLVVRSVIFLPADLGTATTSSTLPCRSAARPTTGFWTAACPACSLETSIPYCSSSLA